MGADWWRPADEGGLACPFPLAVPPVARLLAVSAENLAKCLRDSNPRRPLLAGGIETSDLPSRTARCEIGAPDDSDMIPISSASSCRLRKLLF